MKDDVSKKNKKSRGSKDGFIGTNKVFLQPLSREEEAYYLDRYFEGDEEAKQKLIEHNLRLTAHIAKKFSLGNCDNDELISIGTIGLIKGVNTFKADKKTRLSTYVSRCIENELLMWLRNQKKYKGDLSLQQALGVDKDGNEVTFEDKLCDQGKCVESEVETQIQINEMNLILDKILTQDELTVIKYRYGINCEELTQREIAEIMNISRSYVSRIEKKALKKLEKVLS